MYRDASRGIRRSFLFCTAALNMVATGGASELRRTKSVTDPRYGSFAPGLCGQVNMGRMYALTFGASTAPRQERRAEDGRSVHCKLLKI